MTPKKVHNNSSILDYEDKEIEEKSENEQEKNDHRII